MHVQCTLVRVLHCGYPTPRLSPPHPSRRTLDQVRNLSRPLTQQGLRRQSGLPRCVPPGPARDRILKGKAQPSCATSPASHQELCGNHPPPSLQAELPEHLLERNHQPFSTKGVPGRGGVKRPNT